MFNLLRMFRRQKTVADPDQKTVADLERSGIPEGQAIMLIPYLSAHLEQAEAAKGDFLTEQEFEDVRLAKPAMLMPGSACDVILSQRGFGDIDSYAEYLAYSKDGKDLGKPIMWGSED